MSDQALTPEDENFFHALAIDRRLALEVITGHLKSPKAASLLEQMLKLPVGINDVSYFHIAEHAIMAIKASLDFAHRRSLLAICERAIPHAYACIHASSVSEVISHENLIRHVSLANLGTIARNEHHMFDLNQVVVLINRYSSRDPMLLPYPSVSRRPAAVHHPT